MSLYFSYAGRYHVIYNQDGNLHHYIAMRPTDATLVYTYAFIQSDMFDLDKWCEENSITAESRITSNYIMFSFETQADAMRFKLTNASQ